MVTAIVFLITFLFLVALFTLPLKKKEEKIETYEEPIIEPPIFVPKLTESYLTLDNYIGQRKSIIYLKGHIKRSAELSKALPHILLWGSGGLGKSTLVRAVSREIGGRFIELMPANLRTSDELFSILFQKECHSCGYLNPYSSNKCLDCKERINVYFKPHILLEDKDIILLEECHGLNKKVEEALYSVMQDNYIALRVDGIDQQIDTPDITIAGATTRVGDLQPPFRDRYKIIIKLERYSVKDMATIARMYAKSKDLIISESALLTVASISHGIPRIAKKYIDDSATISTTISKKEVNEILNLLNINEKGLDETHQKAMAYILMRMQASKNGGAGATAIASSIGVPSEVYLDVYEGPLMHQELLFQGSKGRRLTDKALDLYFTEEDKQKIRS